MFQDLELRQSDLAQRVGTNVKYLADAIREGSGTGFYSFLQQYRVDCFKSRLEEVLKQQKQMPNLFELASECGFKSESTFYRHFREAQGLTPRQYSRELRRYLQKKR